MNAAELMVKALENEGVQYIFGVPGEENEDFLFALQTSEISFVPVRHEQGGAFMADVWGRITGNAGVCLATLGPGATNLMTAIADANLDKSPLVAITGQGSGSRLHHESHQVIDVVKMMEPITKWNTSIQEIPTIPEIVRKAFKLAEAEKPGATHIELPEDIAGEHVEGSIDILVRNKVRRPSPDSTAIDLAVEILSGAKKPLILAGNGAIRTRASQALTALVESLNVPVACTFMGKGAVSDRNKMCLGAVGLGFKDYIIEAFEDADVVLCIGYDVAEYDPENWNEDKNKVVLHLDFEPAEVYTHYNPAVEIVGDIAAGIAMIHDRLKDHHYSTWAEDIRDRISESIDQYNFKDSDTDFNAPVVINIVREILPDNGLVISDVGSHKMWIARNYRTFVPNGCLISNGLATMGIALPGGIAAKMVDTERPVICIMGDGGALMNIQELETAKRLDTRCIFLILNDNNYGLIEWKQQMSEGKSFGTNLGNPDFVKLAESFGINGYKPTDVAHLKQILSTAIADNELCVIEVPISVAVNDELTEQLADYYDYE